MLFVMQGDTALHYAALTGKYDYAWRLILQQADVNAVNDRVSIPTYTYTGLLA